MMPACAGTDGCSRSCALLNSGSCHLLQVAEAKARKRQRATNKLEAAKTRANAIADQEVRALLTIEHFAPAVWPPVAKQCAWSKMRRCIRLRD